MLYPMFFTIFLELIRGVLTSTISVQHFDEVSTLFFNINLELLEVVKDFRLPCKKIDPYLASKIINKCQKIPVVPIRRDTHRATNVRMNNLQRLSCSMVLLCWKWCSMMFSNSTGFTELFWMVYRRHSFHHILLSKHL